MRHADVTPALVEAETDRLVSTALALGDPDVAGPSLCEGWTRGHVLAHVARNADALARVCDVALTGAPGTMYDDTASRDADIERDADRPVAQHVTDLRESATRLSERLVQLRPEHSDVRVERTPGGFPIAVGLVPFMRLREVVFHHVDLDAGYTFASAPTEVVSLFLRDAVNRLVHADAPPSLRIRTAEGDEHQVGDGGTLVSGAGADVLGWLARGTTDGVEFDGPVPTLPFGG
ncbi:maleylpyruvate isomerase family mycothiol-dependent enzyme [Terrabacter sp. NPDC080008]|uniref:maleylpyruvate isomerase family mycothiol-dependent enzyme n=1 Tax=Terrabacter sp. NPDC080008 TaxID=3155176 RepID=UPI0034501A65